MDIEIVYMDSCFYLQRMIENNKQFQKIKRLENRINEIREFIKGFN